ncbi:MAG: hypothetical protein IKQ87_11615, partial [Clostridia bacterium]|nr:hypothetical protein [Clostridia bacterium]
MRKRISIGAAIVIALLCSLATFQATFLYLQNRFEHRYLSSALEEVRLGGKTGSQNTAQTDGGADEDDFLSRVTAKLAEVDGPFRRYYIGEIDDDLLIDCVLDGYIVGTGDDYGA